MKSDPIDEQWMARALKLAGKGEGLTRPNPPVGAVIVSGNQVVGEGYHQRAGGPHAEILALREAGVKARGSVLYVSLEPCSSWGRTPPCTEAILSAGIKKVVVAIKDPNPKHAGRGLAFLKRKGVEIVEGVCHGEAEELIRPFARWITTGKPWVMLKLGISLDGRIADREGKSRWISGPDARAAVHALRRKVDAVLVGAETVRLDDPMLLPRPDEGRKPYRIVVTGKGNIPLDAKILNDDYVQQTIIATSRMCPEKLREEYENRGARVLLFPQNKAGRISLRKLFERLGKMGMLQILCEGGGELAESLLKERQVDEILAFIAPKIIGGWDAIPSIGGQGWPLASAPALVFSSVERIGSDIMLRARLMGKKG